MKNYTLELNYNTRGLLLSDLLVRNHLFDKANITISDSIPDGQVVVYGSDGTELEEIWSTLAQVLVGCDNCGGCECETI